MHKKVERAVNEAIQTIRTKLNEAYPNEAIDKFKALLSVLLKIRPVDESKERTAYSNIYWDLEKITLFDRNASEEYEDFYGSLCQIGTLLEGRNLLYREVDSREEDEGINEREDIPDWNTEPHEISVYLAGLIGTEG